jgi:hypothetical protein
MAAEEAAQWLAGPGQAVAEEHREAVRRARAAVAARPAGFDQAGAISAMPAVLAEHREALRQNPASGPYFAERWDVAIADLSRICAIQRHVLTDDATARVTDVDPADILSVATVALPIAEKRTLAAGFDEHKQAWVFSSASPNLRIAGHVRAEVQPGLHAFGFVVALSTSFLQVARYRNRCLLRDGYHRAYGFLAQGITHVPVFTRDYDTFTEMRLPAGLSAQDTYLGDQPPVLSDYLDNTVSASVVMPVTQKVVIVQGVEVATLG